ncbi:hypothetical protein M9H77_12019 [Catharanthus roseus]|uniref:Uncharacterized protein n=1 Tax=Catharanthus roseus TaxID=4058 RepID=A0ACC0BGA9_CATRO|nr:hypothetical protein M9H77_12019 [Catharanthus roseus]
MALQSKSQSRAGIISIRVLFLIPINFVGSLVGAAGPIRVLFLIPINFVGSLVGAAGPIFLFSGHIAESAGTFLFFGLELDAVGLGREVWAAGGDTTGPDASGSRRTEAIGPDISGSGHVTEANTAGPDTPLDRASGLSVCYWTGQFLLGCAANLFSKCSKGGSGSIGRWPGEEPWQINPRAGAERPSYVGGMCFPEAIPKPTTELADMKAAI